MIAITLCINVLLLHFQCGNDLKLAIYSLLRLISYKLGNSIFDSHLQPTLPILLLPSLKILYSNKVFAISAVAYLQYFLCQPIICYSDLNYAQLTERQQFQLWPLLIRQIAQLVTLYFAIL